MPGMSGMSGMMKSDSLMPVMRADLDLLARVPSQFAQRMQQAHEAMASQMLDAMGSDMTMMGMHPDAAWNALVDSVKRDLAELPSLSGSALEARVQAHAGRMRRLLGMHETMMKGMGGK
jgi:anaerobic glycerol-3-phosphate dehydrogenase